MLSFRVAERFYFWVGQRRIGNDEVRWIDCEEKDPKNGPFQKLFAIMRLITSSSQSARNRNSETDQISSFARQVTADAASSSEASARM